MCYSSKPYPGVSGGPQGKSVESCILAVLDSWIYHNISLKTPNIDPFFAFTMAIKLSTQSEGEIFFLVIKRRRCKNSSFTPSTFSKPICINALESSLPLSLSLQNGTPAHIMLITWHLPP